MDDHALLRVVLLVTFLSLVVNAVLLRELGLRRVQDPPGNQVRGGDIYGSVVLADGSKVPGVLITLTGDKIGKRTTISSEHGNFRFVQFPPGGYEVRCELEGFKTVIRKDVELSLGRSVTLNILMETTTLKEEVTVD